MSKWKDTCYFYLFIVVVDVINLGFLLVVYCSIYGMVCVVAITGHSLHRVLV